MKDARLNCYIELVNESFKLEFNKDGNLLTKI